MAKKKTAAAEAEPGVGSGSGTTAVATPRRSRKTEPPIAVLLHYDGDHVRDVGAVRDGEVTAFDEDTVEVMGQPFPRERLRFVPASLYLDYGRAQAKVLDLLAAIEASPRVRPALVSEVQPELFK